MPPASEEICALLRRVFDDPASNVVRFKWTADTGGRRSGDEGLARLLPDALSLDEKRAALKRSIVQFLAGGGRPNVTSETGDAGMRLDAGAFYEFRLICEGARLFVKVTLDFEDANDDDPTAWVISVKRQD